MTDAAQIADRYIAVWNETDPARRRTLLAEGWAESATYVDPLMAAEGLEQIGALIGTLQERFPGFRFKLSSVVDGYADKIRFSWMLGPENEPDMIKGTDVAFLVGRRLKSVIGFLDKVPAGA